MNKAELIDSVASATDMSKAEAGRALDAVLDGIAGALSSGAVSYTHLTLPTTPVV